MTDGERPFGGACCAPFVPVGFGALEAPFKGGTLLTSPDLLVVLPMPQDGLLIRFSVPTDPQLCGASIYMQDVVVDGGASSGFALSRGMKLTFGMEE